jgi:putative transposase
MANQATYCVSTLCRVLGVSPSGYYAWRNRVPSRRKVDDAALTALIRKMHHASRRTYGAPRVHAELLDQGFAVSQKRVARLMRLQGLQGASHRRWIRTTVRQEKARPAPDLVKREFTAPAPNRLWVADITYIPAWEGFLFLAVVLDVFSRRVVGWAMASHMKTDLVLAALAMAVKQRNPSEVVHHSDQGAQYTSFRFGSRCRTLNIRQSMGTVGDCFDNAMCESFFASLECELLWQNSFRSRQEARLAVFDFIEGWYNTHRRHSALDYMSPLAYERMHALAS